MTTIALSCPRKPVHEVAGTAVQVVEGHARVVALLPEYDRLARGCGLPVTARAAWIRAHLDAEPNAEPWAVVVRAADGRMLAAAVLLLYPGAHGDSVVLAGGGQGHRAGIAAVDTVVARALGLAIAEQPALRSGRRTLQLGPLPDDEVTDRLARALRAEVVPSAPVPWVRTGHRADLAGYLSHGVRKTLRKAGNRIVADGLTHSIRFTSDPQVVADLLPRMESAYRGRDREHGLPCLLDTEAGLRLWRGRILRLLDAGCLEAATLDIDGELAAYVLGVRDGNRYGVLEGRFVTELSRYAPGRLLEAAVLHRVIADERFVGLDWMTGVAPETLLAANDADRTVVLRRTAG